MVFPRIKEGLMNTRKKILVADDEVTTLDFFELMLSKLGFTVERAGDGAEAMEKVKHFLPDLILLDNIMPRMSGWDLIKLLKRDPKYKRIPIIMLSALDEVRDKVEALELGADDYITKPFNFSEVLARIKVLLRYRELFAQIEVRESRLNLAEELSAGLKHTLSELVRSIDDLDVTINKLGDPRIVEKTQGVRKHIAELDARIEKTVASWDDLKKNEIGLTALETQLWKPDRE
jgi:CheY-like chemotaxis protein